MRFPAVLLSMSLLLASLVPLTGCVWATQMRLHGQLNQAERAFEQGNYPLAATRYESLSNRYPDGPMREKILMRQGIAYYTVQAYHEARDTFLRYLHEYPQGHYAADANEYIAKVDVLLSPGNPAEEAALAAALQDLNALQKLRMEHPTDPAVATAIGDLYRDLGDYDEAMRYYYEAQELGATFQERDLLQSRLMLDANGAPVPMTPEQVRLRNLEDNPLVIYDVYDYKARDPGENGFNNRLQDYVVTGRIRNQSSRIIHDVELEVRFLNAHHQVLDVRMVRVGTLGPGEIRAFKAKADTYDNLYNIASHEILPRGWE